MTRWMRLWDCLWAFGYLVDKNLHIRKPGFTFTISKFSNTRAFAMYSLLRGIPITTIQSKHPKRNRNTWQDNEISINPDRLRRLS